MFLALSLLGYHLYALNLNGSSRKVAMYGGGVRFVLLASNITSMVNVYIRVQSVLIVSLHTNTYIFRSIQSCKLSMQQNYHR